MPLLTDAQRAQLLANGQRRAADPNYDPVPVAKAYTPDGRVVWLLAFVYPDDQGRVHTLCDAGTGFPGLMDIRVRELETVRGPRGLRVALDPAFVASRTLAAYARQAIADGSYGQD